VAVVMAGPSAARILLPGVYRGQDPERSRVSADHTDGPRKIKIVRVFEFIPLTSALGSVQPQDIEDRVSQDIEDSQLRSPAWQPG
jgi:hypothetical protein